MCPQLPGLSPEYSHKAGLQTVITGMPLQIRPVTRGGHAGPVTMGRITRGPLSWTRPNCGKTSSPVFVWCRSSEGCPCLFCLCQTSGCSEDFERRVASLPSPQHSYTMFVCIVVSRRAGNWGPRCLEGGNAEQELVEGKLCRWSLIFTQ
jgi:hypothetical protein